MAFVKGQSGNPKGREKGSKNRATTELRDFFRDLLEQNREQIVEDLAAIDPLSRLRIIVEMSSFVLPKLASVQAEVQTDTRITLYDRLDALSRTEIEPVEDMTAITGDDLPALEDGGAETTDNGLQ